MKRKPTDEEMLDWLHDKGCTSIDFNEYGLYTIDDDRRTAQCSLRNALLTAMNLKTGVVRLTKDQAQTADSPQQSRSDPEEKR